MYTTVLFDLDGTLLPMDQEEFVRAYFAPLARWAAPRGYEAKPLLDALWRFVAAVVDNDGTRTNRELFWDGFAERFGDRARQDEAFFEEFYRTDFQAARAVCGFAPEAKQAVELLKNSGRRVVLATNPIFPAVATQSRIRWAGLEPSDFEWITTYENSRCGKPNPRYYRDILSQIGCCAEDCLMVGNDAVEDGAAQTVGISVFLLTDCLINSDGRSIDQYAHGDFQALLQYLRETCC